MLIRPKDYFHTFSGKVRKPLGQHFLTQPCTARRIVEALEISPGDTVIEIGPGLGALTAYLIEFPCYLHLVELDKDLAHALQTTIPENINATVFWHIEDILTSDVFNLPSLRNTYRKIKIIGNIPYVISSPLLFRMMEYYRYIETAVIMVQREVGFRWTSQPGTREYGIPTVLIACCAHSERLFQVSPGQFFPKPKVHSTVVRMHFFTEAQWESIGWHEFKNFVSFLFNTRRKTISNILKNLLDSHTVNNILEQVGINSNKRPEQLEPNTIVKLAEAIYNRSS